MGDLVKPKTLSPALMALGIQIVVISLVTLWIAEILPRTLFATVPGVGPVIDLFFLSIGCCVVFITGGIRHVALISMIVSSFTILVSVAVTIGSISEGCSNNSANESSYYFLRKSQFTAVLTAVTSVLQICVARIFFKIELSLLPKRNLKDSNEKQEALSGYECLVAMLLGFAVSAIFFIIFINETVYSTTIDAFSQTYDCMWFIKTYHAFVWTEIIFRVHTIMYFCIYGRKMS